MKAFSQLLMLGLLSPVLASFAAADEQSPAAAAAPDLYVLYKQLPLTGSMSGIVQMQCRDACSVQRSTQVLAGTGGTVEVWQDSRITPAMRAKLWDKAGGAIAFGGQPAKNAVIRLKDASGATVAQSPLEKPLVDLEPLFVGGNTPTYLISLDYHVDKDSGTLVRGILDVDVNKRQMTFATFTGSKTAPVKFPDGQRGDMAVPGSEAIVTFDTNFALQTNASDHTAVLEMTACTAGSYVDYKTRQPFTGVPLTVHTIYEFRDGAWQRRASLEFNHCGGNVLPVGTSLGSAVH
jgi:hypothetical protein